MTNYTRTPERELPLNPRLPLLGIPNQRGQEPQQDSRLVNGYAEQGLDGRWHVFKRPGLTQVFQPPAADATGLGFWKAALASFPVSFWSIGGALKLYQGSNLLYNAGATASPTHFNFTSAYNGAVTLADIATDGERTFLMLATGSVKELQPEGTALVLSCTTTNTSAVVTTASTALLRKYSQISGTGIPADTEIASIDNATTFTMTNPATASGAANLTFSLAGPPTQAVAAVASLNRSAYMISAFSEINGTDVDDLTAWDPLNSIYAYAKAESAVGIAGQLSTIVAFKRNSTEFFRDQGTTPTPLGRVEGLFLDVGLQDVNSLIEIDDTLIWSASQKSGQRSVWSMTKLGAKEVSNPAIRRILSEHRDDSQKAMAFSYGGHTLYVLAIADIPALVYDLTSGLWYYWTALGEPDWPFVDAATGNSGTVYLQHRSNGYIYQLDPEQYDDDGHLIDMDIYPPEFDGGTRKGKYLTRMFINGDQVEGSELKLRVSDDNQLSWTDYRRFDLGHSRPVLEHCGTFTKRFFHFRHSTRHPCQLHEVELEMQVGVL